MTRKLKTLFVEWPKVDPFSCKKKLQMLVCCLNHVVLQFAAVFQFLIGLVGGLSHIANSSSSSQQISRSIGAKIPNPSRVQVHKKDLCKTMQKVSFQLPRHENLEPFYRPHIISSRLFLNSCLVFVWARSQGRRQMG